MKCFGRIPRVASVVLAVVVATLTLAVMVHATQVITTPNAASLTYTLAPFGISANITPVADTPVLILGDQVGTVCGCDNVGSSLMTIVNSTADHKLVWNGFESNKGGLTTGFSSTLGTHIMFIDFSHLVELQVSNATSFRVENSILSKNIYNGKVTLIW